MNQSARECVILKPTNAGNGVFSFHNGSPQIEWDIPVMPKFLDGKSLRINGTFKVFDSAGAHPTNRDDTKRINIDSRTGVSSAIELLSIESQNGQSYEMIKNYNRLCATLMPLQHSFTNYISAGTDMVFGATSKDLQQGYLCDKRITFSMPLLAGILQGQPLDLVMTKGLHITLQLAPDKFVLFDNYFKDQSNNDAVGSYYELSDLTLTFDAIVPPPPQQSAMLGNRSGAWDYISYSSFYTTMTSNDHSSIFNVNKSRVLGAIANIIPSAWINNYNYNSQMITPLLKKNGGAVLNKKAKINNVIWTRGGIRMPLDFEIDAKEKITTDNYNPNAQLEQVNLNSFIDGWSASNFLICPRTELGFGNARPNPTDFFATSVSLNDNDPTFMLGIGYDNVSNQGVNFKGTHLGLRLTSDWTDGNENPHSLYLFVKHRNVIQFDNGVVNIGQ